MKQHILKIGGMTRRVNSAQNLSANLNSLHFRVEYHVYRCLFGGIIWSAELLNLNVTSFTCMKLSVMCVVPTKITLHYKTRAVKNEKIDFLKKS